MNKKITIAIDAMGGENSPDKILKATDVERLFIKINLNSDDTDGVDKEMDPDEFLEGIVHVASMRFMTETTLYSCIQKLVEELGPAMNLKGQN